jgi:peptidoglycan/LPS O-acetylase OafA/YrhL
VPGERRLHSIDALRGAAAVSVVLYHAVGPGPATTPTSGLGWLGLSALTTVTSLGYVGVYLFFVISGFCIHLRWAKARAAGDTARVEFVAFWRRRLRRLYPPYLVALLAYLALAMVTVGVPVTGFFWWNLASHLALVHNLDARTCYRIASVFWTLATEEQLYLAYFLLLALRTRWGWRRALLCCALARVAWFALGVAVERGLGVAIPVSESAAAHWLTWALGALGVEAAVGLIVLPRWCRNGWLGVAALLAGAGLTYLLPLTDPEGLPHTAGWLLLHPVWGLGFFIVVNRLVAAEHRRPVSFRARHAIVWLSAVGLFSYSLYLTHQLVLLHRFVLAGLALPPLLFAFVIVVPATLVFAWLFFLVCERPFMTPRRPAWPPDVQAHSQRA